MRTLELDGFLPVGTVAGDSLVATGAAAYSFVAVRDVEVSKICALVISPVVGPTTAPQVKFSRQTTYGSATVSTALGTLILPNGTAVGKVLYKEFKPVSFKAGEQLVINVMIGSTGTKADGTAIYFVQDAGCEKGILANTDMVETA